MTLLSFLICVITTSITVWLIWSYVSKKWLEEPEYTIILEENGYEIRNYAPRIVAEVEVKWCYKEALNDWFRILAGYIFGWNRMNRSINMTSPVTEKKSKTIRMTSPVADIKCHAHGRIIQFTMPKEYAIENLPTPDDSRIELREIDSKKIVALRYTGWVTEKIVEKKKFLLWELLEKENYSTVWEFISAQYNPPFSFPLMRRNEILIEIE